MGNLNLPRSQSSITLEQCVSKCKDLSPRRHHFKTCSILPRAGSTGLQRRLRMGPRYSITADQILTIHTGVSLLCTTGRHPILRVGTVLRKEGFQLQMLVRAFLGMRARKSDRGGMNRVGKKQQRHLWFLAPGGKKKRSLIELS